MKYKSKQKKLEDMVRGKRAEKEYAKLYSKVNNFNNIEFPTEKEDIDEHWDVKINGVKIDVKAIKKDDENIHFVEFKNVLGKKGWLYGDADGFAFETKDYWIEVKKDDLQEMIHDKCIDKVAGWDFYELSNRPGAKDLFTKVKTIDLCYIGKIKRKV
jgi:hypothetical protein|tara:strand:+ start:13073 stop:13543 length:471 start_codon:yes stop_codon:yes gene_type:complete